MLAVLRTHVAIDPGPNHHWKPSGFVEAAHRAFALAMWICAYKRRMETASEYAVVVAERQAPIQSVESWTCAMPTDDVKRAREKLKAAARVAPSIELDKPFEAACRIVATKHQHGIDRTLVYWQGEFLCGQALTFESRPHLICARCCTRLRPSLPISRRKSGTSMSLSIATALGTEVGDLFPSLRERRAKS